MVTIGYQPEAVRTFFFDTFYGQRSLFTSLAGPRNCLVTVFHGSISVSSIYDRMPKCPSQKKISRRKAEKTIKRLWVEQLFSRIEDNHPPPQSL
jgi:hypothetical protein